LLETSHTHRRHEHANLAELQSTTRMPWAFQALASLTERTPGHKTAIPLISLEDGETGSGVRLKLEEVEPVEYLGQETIEVVGQKVRANKFRLVDPKDPDDQDGMREFWVSESGILLSIKFGGDRGKISLTKYHGPSLGS